MADLHAQLKSFLARRPPKFLVGTGGDDAVNKAGLLPFMGDRLYVMKPRSDRPELGLPPWQICKGTREAGESPAETALREGMEELGLRLDNIEAWYDAGLVEFASATSGKAKIMRLFLARVKSEEDFGEAEATTAARGWMSVEEFRKSGREDHVGIVEKVMKLV